MKQTNSTLFLHLSLIPDVGPGAVLKILRGLLHERFPELGDMSLVQVIERQAALDFLQLYSYTPQDFIKKMGLTEKQATNVVEGLADTSLLEQEGEFLEKHPFTVLNFLDAGYPAALRHIHTPPIVLYCQGSSLSLTTKRLAVVGSRKATVYAQQIINDIVPAMVAHEWEIVSGGAEGADAMAHRATLDAGGTTIAVLGSGLLSPYPLSNKKLFERMIDQGSTIISPFPLGMQPDRGNFPARNRIIAGLSQGCVVVQAAERSGALITAQFALEQGRHVFAVPGSVHEPLSYGCHELIRQGAVLLRSAQDIFEDFGEQIQVSFIPALHADIKKEQNGYKGREPLMVPAAQEEDSLLSHLTLPVTLDTLLATTGLGYAELQDKLFELQLLGKVKQHFTGMWEKI